MSDTPNAPAAAGREQTNSASPLDRATAVARLAELYADPDPAPEGAEPDPRGEPEGNEPSDDAAEGDDPADAETEETAPEEAEADDDADAPAEDAETEDAEAAPEEDRLAHGNMKTRLRDGTVITVGELKKLADEATELRAREPQLVQARQAIEARAAQLAQHEASVTAVAQQVQAALQSALPPLPDPSIAETDWMGYAEQRAQYDAKAYALQQKLQPLIEAQQKAQQEAEAARAAAMQEHAKQQQEKLLARMPELRDPARVRDVHSTITAKLAAMDFTPEEIPRIMEDARSWLLYEVFQKAAAYDKLQAQRPAVEKKVQKTGPAVQRPGRAIPAEEQQQRNLNARINQWREGDRDRKSAAALLADLMP